MRRHSLVALVIGCPKLWKCELVKRVTLSLVVSISVIAAESYEVEPANATTLTTAWLNPVSGDWSDAANWSTNSVYPDNGNGGVVGRRAFRSRQLHRTRSLNLRRRPNQFLYGTTFHVPRCTQRSAACTEVDTGL